MSCCGSCGGWFKRKKSAASHGTPERLSTDLHQSESTVERAERQSTVQFSENKLADDLQPGCSYGAELDRLSTDLHQSGFRESTSEGAAIPSKDASTDLPVERPSSSTKPIGSSSSSSKKSPTKLEDVVRSFEEVKIEQLGEFIEDIEPLVERLVNPEKESSSNSDNLSRWPKIIESGKTFLSFVSGHAEKVDTKNDFFKSGEAAKIAGDILQQIGQIHWAVGALSITGYLLSKCQKVSENKKGYIELLQQMLELASDIKKLNHLVPHNETNEKEKKLLKAFQYVIEGSMFCAAQLDSGKFCSFLKSSVNSENLNAIRSKISEHYQNLNSVAEIEILQSQPVYPKVFLPEYPEAVGIEDQLKKVNSLLKMETSRDTDCSYLIIILWGVGGIGKTTLAEAVVSKIDRSHYNYARITLDEKSEYNKNKYTEMQQQILKDAFPNYMGGRPIKLRDTKDGKDKLRKAFTEEKNKAIFLYIDNALDKKDLEELLPKDLACLPKKSRILITSRTKDIAEVLEEGGFDRIKDYPVKALSNNDAMELLCRDPAVRDRLKADLEKIVNVCQGVPLLLKLVAADLRKEKYDQGRCGQMLDEIIKSITEGEVIYTDLTERMFQFVYGKLDQKTKEAFLDICCCFHMSESRKNVEKIVCIQQVRRLEEAALITPVEVDVRVYSIRLRFVKEERLSVHDIIRSIGRRLGKSNRIMDVHDWVEAEKDEARLKKIEVVYLPKGNEGYTLQGGHLNSMKEKLRILYLEDNINVCVTGMVTLPELRMARIYGDISWLNFEALNKLVILTCQQLHIPHTALLKMPESLKRISILSLKSTNTTDLLKIKPNSSLEELFVNVENGGEASTEEEESEAFTEEEDKASFEKDKYNSAEVFNKFLDGLNNLKFLHILNRGSLSEFPEQICRLPQLMTLLIRFFGKTLPRSIGLLTSLKHLDLGDCFILDELPSTVGQLINLTHLNLIECHGLKELPETFGQLTNLTHLDLSGCESLKELPETFGQLTNLTHLDLSFCESLKELPETFGQLTNLTHLDLRGCYSLKELPETFGQLTNLIHLDLSWCESLKKLPETFGQLTNLTDLNLRGLEVVPDIVKGFRNCLTRL